MSAFLPLPPPRCSTTTCLYTLENTHVYVPSRVVFDQLPSDVLARFPRRYGHLAVILPVPTRRVRVQRGRRGVRDPRIGHHSGGFACGQTHKSCQPCVKPPAITYPGGSGHKNDFLHPKIVCAPQYQDVPNRNIGRL